MLKQLMVFISVKGICLLMMPTQQGVDINWWSEGLIS
jgi:hypothetical protein